MLVPFMDIFVLIHLKISDVCSVMLVQVRSVAAIRSSLFFLEVVLASLYTAPYMAKSRGLMSGDEGGHHFFDQKRGKLFLQQVCTQSAP